MASQAGRDSDKFMLRLPDGMREQISLAAEANARSMNSEIVARLSESLNQGFGEGLLRLHLFVSAPHEKLNAADVLEAYAKFLREEAAKLMDQEAAQLAEQEVENLRSALAKARA
jgi:hypothetical protein